MSVTYTPRLDELLTSQKLVKVPYRINGECKPRVGGMYWSYRKNDLLEVKKIIDGRIVIVWGNNPRVEQNVDKIDANLELRDIEIDLFKFAEPGDPHPMLPKQKFFDRIKRGGTDEVSLRGAEIKYLCHMRMFPITEVSILMCKYFTNNRRTNQVSDYAYYYIVDNSEASYDRRLDLVRDLEKSPRKKNTVGDNIEHENDDTDDSWIDDSDCTDEVDFDNATNTDIEELNDNHVDDTNNGPDNLRVPNDDTENDAEESKVGSCDCQSDTPSDDALDDESTSTWKKRATLLLCGIANKMMRRRD